MIRLLIYAKRERQQRVHLHLFSTITNKKTNKREKGMKVPQFHQIYKNLILCPMLMKEEALESYIVSHSQLSPQPHTSYSTTLLMASCFFFLKYKLTFKQQLSQFIAQLRFFFFSLRSGIIPVMSRTRCAFTQVYMHSRSVHVSKSVC